PATPMAWFRGNSPSRRSRESRRYRGPLPPPDVLRRGGSSPRGPFVLPSSGGRGDGSPHETLERDRKSSGRPEREDADVAPGDSDSSSTGKESVAEPSCEVFHRKHGCHVLQPVPEANVRNEDARDEVEREHDRMHHRLRRVRRLDRGGERVAETAKRGGSDNRSDDHAGQRLAREANTVGKAADQEEHGHHRERDDD